MPREITYPNPPQGAPPPQNPLHNINLLQAVYKTSDMGQQSLDLIIGKVRDDLFRHELTTQHDEFVYVQASAREMLTQLGIEPQEVSVISKTSAWGGIQFNILVNRENSHLAEMIIHCNTSAIIELSRDISQNPMAETNATELANRLIAVMEGAVDRMKDYL